MARKRRDWKKDDRVIFNDLGNWGSGRIENESEPSDSSRWYWVAVDDVPCGAPPCERRLLRADDLCIYSERKWRVISDSLTRLQELRQEKSDLQARILEAFNADWDELTP